MDAFKYGFMIVSGGMIACVVFVLLFIGALYGLKKIDEIRPRNKGLKCPKR